MMKLKLLACLLAASITPGLNALTVINKTGQTLRLQNFYERDSETLWLIKNGHNFLPWVTLEDGQSWLAPIDFKNVVKFTLSRSLPDTKQTLDDGTTVEDSRTMPITIYKFNIIVTISLDEDGSFRPELSDGDAELTWI